MQEYFSKLKNATGEKLTPFNEGMSGGIGHSQCYFVQTPG